jgi:V/A-type H+-transporting ATPase subunit E
MSAEKVIEKILTDAREQAAKIIKQAQQDHAGEDTKFNQELNRYKSQTEILAQKAAKQEKLHILSAVRMEIAKQRLAEKRKILDDVFNQARQQVVGLPEHEYRQLMVKLMLDAVETGNEEIILDKNENRINQDVVNQVNQQLASQGKGNLKLSNERQDISGGFILRRGKIKTNASLDVLLNQARKEVEIELAKELFA